MVNKKANSKVTGPGPTNRTTVIGRTGSGKSQFAAYLLSMQNFDEMPWIIVDFKNEDSDIINQIQGIQYVDYGTIPERPGIYMLKPNTEDGKNGVMSDWLKRVLEHGRVGLLFDEVFPVGQHNEGFNTIMMQGRSRLVPIICCTQRPSNVSTYCFSEASYYMIFDLTRKSDRVKVAEEISAISRDYKLPEFQSYYYNVPQKHLAKMGAAPKANQILAKIEAKMPPPRRTL